MLAKEKNYELFSAPAESSGAADRIGVRCLTTNVEVFPCCGQDLSIFYSYLVGRNEEAAAQDLLHEVIQGKLPISLMVETVPLSSSLRQKPGC